MACKTMGSPSACVIAGVLLGLSFASSSWAGQAPPDALVKMRAAFAAAAKAKDGASLAEMTVFPLVNEVYAEPKSISKAAFRGHVAEYSGLAQCLASAPLSADEETAHSSKLWLIFCDGIAFYFGLRDGQWRHVKFANVNE